MIRKKRLLSIALCLCLICTILPAPTRADGAGSNSWISGTTVRAQMTGTTSFNIMGLDGSKDYQTTFRNAGYRTAASVDGGTLQDNAGSLLASGLKLNVQLAIEGKNFIKVIYTLSNTGAKAHTVKLGSHADVMIDRNDRAPIRATEQGGNRLSMTGSPKNGYAFKLIADSCSTIWYGFYRNRTENCFTNMTDRGPNKIYRGDSGLAYAWEISISPGGTWTSYVLIGTGNLDQMNNITIPTIPQPKPVTPQPSIALSTSDAYFTEDDELPSNWRTYISSSEGDVTITGTTIDSKTPGDYSVVYTASNSEGTASKKLTVHILPKPAELSKTTATRSSGSESFRLSATMKQTGGLRWMETGFVYGALQNPTLTLKDGSVTTTPAVSTKNGSLTASVTNLTAGIAYYARAYAKTSDGTVIYGAQSTSFGLGAPSYGVFSVTNSGSNTFTIKRTGGTDDRQTVYYRTVNGSAIGGTHFTHAAGSVVFAKGETTKNVTVTEQSVTTPFKTTEPATAYSNADRTYQLEIYRVDGGATINANENKATRTMTVGSSYHVDANIFNKTDYVTVGPSGETLRGDFDSDKLGWTYGNKIGKAAKETVTIPKSSIPKPDYWKNVGTALGYQVYFQAKEKESGYQHVQLTTGDSIDTAFYPEKGTYKDRDTNRGISSIADTKYKAFYAITFEHGGSGTNTSYLQYSLPAALTNNWKGLKAFTKDDYYSSSLQSFLIPFAAEKLTMGFSGSGSGSDKWYTNQITHRFRVIDTKGPQLLGLAPTATATYRPGDKITIAMVFDEIVDKKNSEAAGLSASTTLKVDFASKSSSNSSNSKVNFTYAGGADTNVLYFTGTVPGNAKGAYKLEVSMDTNLRKKVCDMSNNPAAEIKFFYKTEISISSAAKPTVTVNSLTNSNGTLTGSITATNADKLEYAWTQTATMPTSGWRLLPPAASSTVTTRQTSGTWYLHVRATNADGQTATANNKVTIPTSGAGTYAAPELTVSVDNINWAKTRNITVTRSPGTATVKVKPPGGTVTTVSGSSYTAKTEGIYTFTLTSGSGSNKETVTRQAVVSKLDTAAPVITIHDLPDTSYTERVSLNFSVADSGSGVNLNSITAKWKNTAITPVKNTDGTYTITCPDTAGSGKFTVTAADKLDNSASKDSNPYTINLNAPTLTVRQTSSTQKGVTYSYEVTANGNTGIVVHLPDGTETTNLNGSFTLTEAGTYAIIVTDAAGHFISKDLTVSGEVDGTPPEVRLYPDESSKTGNLTVAVGVYEKGSMPTVKRGSTALTMKKEGDGIYSSSFTVTKGDTYTVTARDTAGNSAEASIIVYALVDDSSKTLKLAVDGTYGTLPEPAAKHGYTFDGWYTAGGTKVTTSGSPQTDGYTLYAHWTAIISVDITWSALEFTYSDGTWNPEKHAYENGGWKTKTPDSNQISVENKGEAEVKVTFRYTQKNSAVSGSFTDNAGEPITSPMILPEKNKKYAYLTLAGTPNKNLESAEIGTVTITLGGD